MARPEIAKLYKRLVTLRFGFMPRGEHTLDNIYRTVKAKYPRLCDDDYLCSENCLSIHQQPEWKHTVRSALNNLKISDTAVLKGGRRSHWRFLRAADVGKPWAKRRKPRRKLAPCPTCGENSYGWWTSSATGLVRPYCRPCRDMRRINYLKRKARSGGNHTTTQWLQKLNRFARCPGCGRAWEDIPPRPNKRYKNTWTKDHIVPLSKGGSDDISNIQPLCYQCQFHKNARH